MISTLRSRSLARTAPTFETDRLRLSTIGGEDHSFLVRLDSDPRVMEHVNCGPLTPQKSSRFAKAQIDLERMRQESCPLRRLFGKWIVSNKESQEPIGWVETFKFSYGERGKWLGDFVGIGYEFVPERWGQGFAPEAVACLLDYLRTIDEHTVFAYVRKENLRSIRVLKKLDFKRLRRTVKDDSGTPCILFRLQLGQHLDQSA